MPSSSGLGSWGAERSILGHGLPAETEAAWLQASGTYRQHCCYAAEPHCSLPTQPYSFPEFPPVLPALRKSTPSFSQAGEEWQALSKLHLVKGQVHAKG